VLAFALMALTGATIASAQETPSSEQDIKAALFGGVPMGRWKEGQLFDGIKPQPWLKSAANWFPRTEDVQPNEMRIIFMGSAPFIRPGQMNTSILVQLGNGENFIFDLGEGSVANYIASGFALNEFDKVFITHLHIDHFGALPYLYEFGGWAGRWHKVLQGYGPSGRTPEYGTRSMIDGMKKMLAWHDDAFSVFPVGKGHDIEVHEFPFRDNGGVVYDKDGVRVIHWQRSHAKDGAWAIASIGTASPSSGPATVGRATSISSTRRARMSTSPKRRPSSARSALVCRACRRSSRVTPSTRTTRQRTRRATWPTRSSRGCS
jgi:hypothetical protein